MSGNKDARTQSFIVCLSGVCPSGRGALGSFGRCIVFGDIAE
jgi:hypothetical protein